MADNVRKLYLNTKELSIRWAKSIHTLKKWRAMGKGPHVCKIGGHPCYRIEDIEAYERNAHQEESITKDAAHE